MSKAYCCVFTTPQGSQSFEADTWACLVGMLSRLIAVGGKPEAQSELDVAAKAVLTEYNERFWRIKNKKSWIVMAGLELDLIRCYLRGLSTAETIRWFGDNRGFKTTKSSVQRYWGRFRWIKSANRGIFAAADKGK